jgi:hypothetical protein
MIELTMTAATSGTTTFLFPRLHQSSPGQLGFNFGDDEADAPEVEDVPDPLDFSGFSGPSSVSCDITYSE